MVITPEQHRGALLAPALRAFSGVVLLTALAVAPLYYGATRAVPFHLVLTLTGLAGVLWLFSCASCGACSLPPRIFLVGAGCVLASAMLWLVFLQQPELPAFTKSHLSRINARWPNSVVSRQFGTLILWALSVILAMIALHDLARDPVWRRATGFVLLFSGVAVALLGLVQNATRAKGIYWENTHRMPGAFFGTFFHHTSAGAYLNTVWPMGFALALTAIRNNARSSRVRFSVFVTLVCATLVLAAHSGHVSRLPQVLALFTFVFFALWAGLWRVLGQIRGLRIVLGSAVAIVAATVLFFGASRLNTISARWSQLEWSKLWGTGETAAAHPPVSEWRRLMRDDLFIPSNHRGYPLGDRGAAYAVALRAIGDRPWLGWGPAGWTAAAAAHSTDPFVRTFYLMVQFPHQDYLQTWVEWGLVGAVGWLLLVPGAVVYGVRRLGARPSHDFIGAAAVTGLAAVLVQSLIDFPLQIPAIQLNAAALAALAWSAPAAPLNSGSRPPFSFS